MYWPITIKLRIRKQTSKQQINYRCCLRFSYLVPYWLISRNTIAFHKYLWCSGFYEFHNTFLFLNNQFTISTEAIMHLVYPPPQKNCVHRWKRSFEFIINWKYWSGKILGVNKVPYGLVKNCQVDSWHWWQILQDTLHSKKIVWHQLVEGSMWCHCWIVLYLMSRFFLITAQTREFPTILVMISTDVTTVTAISADSDMTMSVFVTITEIIYIKKTVSNNLAKVLPRTLCIKRTFRGCYPPIVCTWVGSFDRTYVAVTIKWLLNGKRALRALYQGIGSTPSFVSRQRW